MKPSFLKSVSFAINGIKLSWHEKHFKIHLIATALCVAFGFLFDIKRMEWIAVLICVGAVLSLEMINTAIEHLVDMVEPNFNPKAGAIKDLAAGAVLVSSIVAFICGVLIFGKYVLDLFSLT